MSALPSLSALRAFSGCDASQMYLCFRLPNPTSRTGGKPAGQGPERAIDCLQDALDEGHLRRSNSR